MAEERFTRRTVTVVMAVIAALAFVFSFGNVWALALRLGVPRPIAPLIAPMVDLSVVGAIASSFRDIPIDPGTVMIGEVGLSGELRSVGDLPRRLREAARLGFSRAIVPAYRRDQLPKIDGLTIRTARTVGEAIDRALRGEQGDGRGERGNRADNS